MDSRFLNREVFITAKGVGDVSLLLRSFLTAKFRSEDELESIFSPVLNELIRTCMDFLENNDAEAVSYYEKWVAAHHRDRVVELVGHISEFNGLTFASPRLALQQALYPGRLEISEYAGDENGQGTR